MKIREIEKDLHILKAIYYAIPVVIVLGIFVWAGIDLDISYGFFSHIGEPRPSLWMVMGMITHLGVIIILAILCLVGFILLVRSGIKCHEHITKARENEE